MGFYGDRILPRVVDKLLDNAEVRAWRERTVAGLQGRVVEIGFGSGLNVPLYPDTVERVEAIEPSALARRLAGERIDASPVDIGFSGLDGGSLPLDDASLDGALSTFTLCTVPHPETALAELRRVLKRGARFHLLEHGLAPDSRVQRRQRRIDRVWPHVGGGCHLSRDTLALVRSAGFDVTEVEQRFNRGPKSFSWFTRAVVVNP